MAWFFIIFFSAFALTNLYLLRRVWQGLACSHKGLRLTVIFLLITASLSYMAARAVLGGIDNYIYTAVLWVGSVWFAFMHYSIMFVWLGELFRLILRNKIRIWQQQPGIYELIKFRYTIVSFVLVIITVTYGYFNAQNIVVKEIELSVKAPDAQVDSLRIAFFADSHLTPVNSKQKAKEIVEKINSLNPDIILAAGDIVDDQIFRLLSRSIDEPLRNFRSIYGTYVCNGNHEYIVGVEEADAFLSGVNIHVLRDSFVTIAGSVIIAGREDSSISRFTDKSRKDVKELLGQTESELPVIVLDHQPFNLSKTARAGAALQLSGHTHNGQLWPINYITSMIYEVSWGYKQIDGMHVYVTSGVGTWGPPIRTGSDAEVVLIRLKFIR